MTAALISLALAVAFVLGGAARADEPDEERRPTVRIEAPGARIVLDGERGTLEVEAGDARLHADETGQLDLRADGITIRVTTGDDTP